jgi:hypothetical protein
MLPIEPRTPSSYPFAYLSYDPHLTLNAYFLSLFLPLIGLRVRRGRRSSSEDGVPDARWCILTLINILRPLKEEENSAHLAQLSYTKKRPFGH